jgi:hypothetical protein
MDRDMLWGLQGSAKAVRPSDKSKQMEGKTVMLKIAVGVTSATLLFCTFGMVGGQNGDKDSSHPAFKVLNGSHANPRITLAELLDSYEKAVGGKEAVEKIRTVIAHERRHSESKAGDQRFGSSVDYFKFPDKAKSVLTLPNRNRGVTGFDGKTAWYYTTSDGFEQSSPEESALLAQELNLFNLLHLRATFPQMTLVGSSKVEGRDVYMVDASTRDLGLYRSLYFDAETRLLTSSVVVVQLGNGKTAITNQVYSDFRVVHGVKFPFALRSVQFDEYNLIEVKRTRIECNIPLRDDFFSMNSTTAERSGT